MFLRKDRTFLFYTNTHTQRPVVIEAGGGILTYGLLANNAPGLFDAGGAGGGGAALPHGCRLARLVPAPAFGEGAIHDLPLALGADAWCGRMDEDRMSRCTFNGPSLRSFPLSVTIHLY